jgi:hypothetical protein
MQTCIIAGNGPSLKSVPLSFLGQYPSFGTNRCYLKFTPDYYAVINPLVIRQNLSDINNLSCMKFAREDMKVAGAQLKPSTREPFSFAPLAWINEGYTVTYVCLQLAYWMGFRTIYLVGLDHRYQYEGKPNETRTMGDDPNHFDPSYFAGQQWQNPDLENSAKYYAIARKVYELDGRRIYNLTPNTALDVFTKGVL